MVENFPNMSMLIGPHTALGDIPRGIEVLLHIGRGYARRYQLKAAEAMLTKAAALAPHDPTVLMALADVQMARGEYAQAQAGFQAANASAPAKYVLARLQVASASDLCADNETHHKKGG